MPCQDQLRYPGGNNKEEEGFPPVIVREKGTEALLVTFGC